MCWMAAIPVAMAGVQALSSSHASAKATGAEITAMRRQSKEQIKQMNIQNADLTLQQRDELEEAQDELTSQNLQKVQAMGSIRAAIGEGNLEGQSLDRVQRVTGGDYIREANKVTENYHRNYAAIFQQQIGLTESTRSAVSARNKSEPKGKSKLAQALDFGASVGSSFASQYAAGGFSSGGTKAPISAAKGTKTGR